MTSASDNFRAEAATRILVKDGAYGTMIQAEKLVEADYRGDLPFALDQRGNNDLLNLTRPALIEAICKRFVDAGADILATNTFNATSISQSDYGPEAVALADEMNRASARIIRKVTDAATALDGKPRWVAGAIGPTNKTLSLSPKVDDPGFREVDFDGVKAAYRAQVDALLDGGVDFILVETVFDTLNAKSAIMAVIEAGNARGLHHPDHGLDDPHRPQRPQPVGSYGRGILGQRPPCPPADHRPQTARSARRSFARTSRHCPARPRH